MSWLDMLLKEGERASCLRSDLPYFAEHCLKLRPKTGSLAPLIFNPAQLELHRRIEEQKAKTGRVRVIVPQGSTARHLDLRLGAFLSSLSL